MRFLQRIKCFFLGHSHPWFTCFYCGRPSQLAFKRDESGEVVRDEHGVPIIVRK